MISDLFSKRLKRLRGEVPDVYVYDSLPNQLRVQIVYIIEDAIGRDRYGQQASSVYTHINRTLCREYGKFELVKNARTAQDAVVDFFLTATATEHALDVIEVCFGLITNFIANDSTYRNGTARKIEAVEAVTELNERFKEHGVGYQFVSGELIRVDSEFLHKEAVLPTLTVLRGKEFQGANEEFLLAHEHYRHGRFKECLVFSLKAFESTIKAICKIRGWTFQAGDTAKSLIAICLKEGLIPQYSETQFATLRGLLESGVPTMRNKNGGHGQGADIVDVPAYLARYALNLTATTILFLTEANNSLK